MILLLLKILCHSLSSPPKWTKILLIKNKHFSCNQIKNILKNDTKNGVLFLDGECFMVLSKSEKGTQTIKMIQLWLCALRDGVCFLSSFICDFFSSRIVLKIRVKHGKANCSICAMLLKSLLPSTTIFICSSTWRYVVYIRLVLVVFFKPSVHRMAQRIHSTSSRDIW